MSEHVKCPCLRCVRNRANERNRWWRKQNQPWRCIKLPEVPRDFKCNCPRCIAAKIANIKKRGRHGLFRKQASSCSDFKPFGPGRYPWDRTTKEDYEHESNPKQKTQDPTSLA